MSAPSAKELSGAFPKLTSEKAEELARKLREACDSDEDDAIDDALEAANDALGGNGVEGVEGEGYTVDKYWQSTVLVYVNLGDTYDTTICYDTECNEFSIGSWGDFMEDWEKGGEEDEEEEGEDDEEDDEEDDTEEAVEEGTK